uniref:immunoglobulin domain-containing protein n=1 Tax=Muriicola sp. TaxID=2020856 RepID=UPI0035686DFA
PCGGETILDFSTPPSLESGSPLSQGAVYRFPNITTGVDALVDIEETFNATVANIDNNSADAASFKPQTAFNLANIGDQAYVRYRFRFVTSGGSTPVVIPRFFMNFNDIDGGSNYGEQNWADNPSSYTVSNPTELNMNTNGSWVIGTAGPNDYPGAGNGNPQVNFSVNYNSKSEMVIRVGAVARVNGASSGGRQHAIEFSCITNYVNPVTYGIDNDSDGVANHLDLDSDNDGIFDAVEAGHNRAHASGAVTSTYGLNGLADLVETAPESGSINYAISNADATEPPDYLDTDSDDDGCSDANEAYNDSNADGGDNEYYDTGMPPATDAQGRVSSATYQVPADVNTNSTYDFKEADAPPSIASQPTDTDICPGCTEDITVISSDTDSYQWQIFNGVTWDDLSDGGLYSGANTNTLTITNPTTAEDGNLYRVVLNNSMYICTVETSDQAQLNIRVNTVISNRKITYRVNKD